METNHLKDEFDKRFVKFNPFGLSNDLQIRNVVSGLCKEAFGIYQDQKHVTSYYLIYVTCDSSGNLEGVRILLDAEHNLRNELTVYFVHTFAKRIN